LKFDICHLNIFDPRWLHKNTHSASYVLQTRQNALFCFQLFTCDYVWRFADLYNFVVNDCIDSHFLKHVIRSHTFAVWLKLESKCNFFTGKYFIFKHFYALLVFSFSNYPVSTVCRFYWTIWCWRPFSTGIILSCSSVVVTCYCGTLLCLFLIEIQAEYSYMKRQSLLYIETSKRDHNENNHRLQRSSTTNN